MPYAHDGIISQRPIANGVTISAEQYEAALTAVLEGLEVTIDGGFALREKRPSEHHMWENGEWVDKTPEPEPAPEPPLTARQLRLGLVRNGFALDQVEATIAAIEDEQDRAVANVEWEHASQFERTHPLLRQVAAALGLSEGQIDAMWEQALAL